MSDQAERDAYTAANDGEDLPQTYDEWLEVDIDRYERICQHFTRPDENLYGTAFQWSKVYDFVSCYAYPFMFSNGGEAWDPATGQVEGIANWRSTSQAWSTTSASSSTHLPARRTTASPKKSTSLPPARSPPAGSGPPWDRRC